MQFNIPAEFKNAAGVYIIRNTVNDKVYVGSTVKLWKRYKEHLSGLKTKQHFSRKLQNFVLKYGLDVLAFHLLEITESDKNAILSCEQKWLDEYQPTQQSKGFNTHPVAASSLGVKHGPLSDELKRRLSEIGKRRPPEIIAQQTALLHAHNALHGSPNTGRRMSESRRLAMIEQRKGKSLNLSSEQRAASSERTKKLWENPEYRSKVSERIRPEKTAEARKQQAQGLREWWAGKSGQERKKSPESIAKREATRKANMATKPRKRWSDDARQKVSEQRKGMNAGTKWSAERIAKRTATLKANRTKEKEVGIQLTLL